MLTAWTIKNISSTPSILFIFLRLTKTTIIPVRKKDGRSGYFSMGGERRGGCILHLTHNLRNMHLYSQFDVYNPCLFQFVFVSSQSWSVLVVVFNKRRIHTAWRLLRERKQYLQSPNNTSTVIVNFVFIFSFSKFSVFLNEFFAHNLAYI